jgi:hypothetical protein
MAVVSTSDAARAVPEPGAPHDMRQHVRAAYALLCEANKKAIQVPADVVAAITAARKMDAPELPDELEARFWNAYGLLASSIGPAEKARRLYRWVFYCVLALLLLFQFVFTAGDHLRGKLAEVEKQLAVVEAQLAARGSAAADADKTAPTPAAPAAAGSAAPAATSPTATIERLRARLRQDRVA